MEEKNPSNPHHPLLRFSRKPMFWPFVVLFIGIVTCFWPLLDQLPSLWFGGSGYYSQGVLIPFLSVYIIYSNWPQISKKTIQTGWIAILPLLIALYFLRAAYATELNEISSVAFLVILLSLIWFIAGIQWMLALAFPVLFLMFALPIWTSFIDVYTNPLQIDSTTVAYKLLQLFGQNPLRADPVSIYLDNFALTVAIPCSGLKLLLALSAFTVFFMLIAHLKWWANLIMLAIVLPLSLFINGLRVALVGLVGNQYGEQAGVQFHEYSGYVTIIICFLLLFQFARWLGWNR